MDPIFHNRQVVTWLGGLAAVSHPQEDDLQKRKAAASRGAWAGQRSKYSPYTTPFPICKNWNYKSCSEASCRFQHICMECRSPNRTGKECLSRGSVSSREEHNVNNSGKPFLHECPRKGW